MYKLRHNLGYFLISFALITVVDDTTAFNLDWQHWVARMPVVWIFYLAYPLPFTWLINKLNLRCWRLSLAVLTTALLFEIVVFGNPLFGTFALNLLMTALALRFMPLLPSCPCG